jgi:RNase H-like domain found in reverse transcriptase
MLAIIEALCEWRQYLLGAIHPFEIWTDHLNLTYYRKPQNLTKRQARWVTDLQEYVFTIHHLPG